MKRNRRAIMLVELLVGLITAVVVVMIVGLIMANLMRVNLQAKEHQQLLMNLGRLSQQFRRDVHDAMAAHVEQTEGAAPGDRLSLELGSRTVEYSIATDGIERAVSEGGAAAARELFVLPGFKPLALELDEHRRQAELTIGRLAHRGESTEELTGTFSILAVLQNQPSREVPQ